LLAVNFQIGLVTGKSFGTQPGIVTFATARSHTGHRLEIFTDRALVSADLWISVLSFLLIARPDEPSKRPNRRKTGSFLAPNRVISTTVQVPASAATTLS
jgi:hypothetical protein